MRSKKLFLTYTCTFNRFRGAGRAVESVFIRLSLFKNLISTFKLMHQSLPAAPSPPPPPHSPGYCGAFARPVSPGGGAFANFALHGGRAFDTHEVSYQNLTTQRILLEKQADWLICQRWEKIEEVCKDMFSILCMHFFIAYPARIT